MIIDRLLARFSIQTKVVVFIIPLIAGMAGLAAINLYTGNLLGARLTGTNASIETLSGFKEAYAGMTNFLHDQSEEKRAAVMQSLDAQLQRVERVLELAETETESAALTRSRTVAEALRADVDALWSLHNEVTGIYGAFDETLGELANVRGRLNDTIDTVGQNLAEAEDETKTLLRAADQLGNGAQAIVAISSAIAGAATPEEAYAAADDLKRDIRKMSRDLPKVIPETKPALKSLLSDNLEGLLAVQKAGAVSEAGMIELQKYANALRPSGIMLQGLASQVARDATLRFGQLDDEILMGQQIVSDSRDFLAHLSALELSIVHFLGQPDETRGEDVAAKLSRVDQSIQLIAFSNGGEIVMEAIGEVWSAKSVTIPALMAELIEKKQAETSLFMAASERIDEAWSSVLDFTSSQQQGAEAVKDRASGITLSAAAHRRAFGLLAAFMLIAALKGPILPPGPRHGRCCLRRSRRRCHRCSPRRRDRRDGPRARRLQDERDRQDPHRGRKREGTRDGRPGAPAVRHREGRRPTPSSASPSSARLRRCAISPRAIWSPPSTPRSPANSTALRLDFNESVEQHARRAQPDPRQCRLDQGDSAQLRSAADDLARRTEQQAASLEETAAAVDEITRPCAPPPNVRRNRPHGRRDPPEPDKSGKIVTEAVDAMSRIEEASEDRQIIGVIDEIAFQTNLLALNAGVEAAGRRGGPGLCRRRPGSPRAGAAGRQRPPRRSRN
jgi:methyl-accepting chemotaxis protein